MSVSEVSVSLHAISVAATMSVLIEGVSMTFG
jgi:hypothetical protein